MNKEELLTILESSSIIQGSHKLWQGPLNSHGYGQITYHGRKLLIHRISAYLYLNLNIDDSNIQANHKLDCEYKNCWNHEHLYLGNQIQNMRDLTRSGK
jgi:hypothetical protein